MRERKPFDETVRRLLEERAAAAARLPVPESNQERVEQARALMTEALTNRQQIAGLPNEVKTRGVEITPQLEGRLYLPQALPSEQALPVMVYLHGGGWVVGNVAALDPFCRLLSQASSTIILSVEYRLAPEHPYPAAVEDTLSAVDYVRRRAPEWNGDPNKIALGGDSAGGNLAAVAAHRLCASPGIDFVRALVLICPVMDHPHAGHASYTENARGTFLEPERMQWFAQQYAPEASQMDPDVWPLRIDPVPPLPPTLVTTAEYDILRDEAIAYADKLRAAGVPVTHLHAPDMSHNFAATPHLVARVPQAQQGLDDIAHWLRKVFA